jgi:hypothetical protein
VERIKLAPGAEGAPMALLLSQMMGENLDRPEKLKDFNSLGATVHIHVKDVGTEVTMVFDRGSLTFHGDKPARPDISIETDSETLLDLANVSIKFGLPYYFDKVGLGILKKLAKRELKIRGMFTHPIALVKVSKIMSID